MTSPSGKRPAKLVRVPVERVLKQTESFNVRGLAVNIVPLLRISSRSQIEDLDAHLSAFQKLAGLIRQSVRHAARFTWAV